MPVRSRLSEIRRRRGLRAAELAARAGISRQTIYAIEAGSYVPNTAVALQLARLLDAAVEDLFSLEPEAASATTVQAEALAATGLPSGQPARIGRLGPRYFAVPASPVPFFLPEADGVVAAPAGRSAMPRLEVFPAGQDWEKCLLLAGCDPAISVLARFLMRTAGVELVPAFGSSRQALQWLKAGKVHAAGSHLEDPESGEFNLPQVRRMFPREELVVVSFARWEEGLVVLPGNPKQVRGVEDLARRGVRIVNREPGSGSRLLLDRQLRDAGIAPARVAGYDSLAAGHLAAAWAVVAKEADCCLATRSAALAFGLGFVPLRTERYDLVLRKRSLEAAAVQSLLDTLSRAALRRRLEALAGYDTSVTGSVLALR
jgi:putative molybdopterin biosynthesis protein